MDEQTKKLINIYTKARQRLIDIVTYKTANGYYTGYDISLIKQINAEINRLNLEAKGWVQTTLPTAYYNGINEANKGLEKQGVDVPIMGTTLEGLHTQAVEMIVKNTTDTLINANNWVGRQWFDIIRQAGIEFSLKRYTDVLTPKAMAKELQERLIADGVNGVRKKNGAVIPMDKYAELVARTTPMEASNRAKMNQLQGLDYDLVQMTTHFPTCSICASLQGRVYSISGTNSKFPPLAKAYSGMYANIHPHCRHTIVPYVVGFKTTEQYKKDIEFSNRAFNTDPRSQAEIDKYNAEQKKKAELNADAKKFKEIKEMGLPNAPKTLSAFRSMKKANSERYQDLISDYKAVKKGVDNGGDSGIIKAKTPHDIRKETVNKIKGHSWFNQIKDIHKDEIHKVFENATDGELNFWAKHGHLVQGDFYSKKNGAYYSPGENKIHMNLSSLKNDSKRIKVNSNIVTFFHEIGHLFDDNAIKLTIGKEIFQELPDLKTKLKDDYLKFANNLLANKGEKPLKTIEKLSISQKQILNDDLLQDMHLKNAISDIMEGLTNGRLVGNYGNYGHIRNNRDYWKRPNALEKESIAHMFEAKMLKSERLDIFKKYFPTAYKYFEEYIEKI